MLVTESQHQDPWVLKHLNMKSWHVGEAKGHDTIPGGLGIAWASAIAPHMRKRVVCFILQGIIFYVLGIMSSSAW